MLEPFFLSYAGLVSFAASTRRIRNDVRWRLPDPLLMKMLGVILLLVGLWRAVVHFGPYQGPVASIGLLCLSGVTMVLVASRQKRLALILSAPALLLAIILATVGA